jgi:hypothetical protein
MRVINKSRLQYYTWEPVHRKYCYVSFHKLQIFTVMNFVFTVPFERIFNGKWKMKKYKVEWMMFEWICVCVCMYVCMYICVCVRACDELTVQQYVCCSCKLQSLSSSSGRETFCTRNLFCSGDKPIAKTYPIAVDMFGAQLRNFCNACKPSNSEKRLTTEWATGVCFLTGAEDFSSTL